MKISSFVEVIKAGKNAILPIVENGVNRKITVDNLKKSMEIASDDITYESQNAIDAGGNLQESIANIAISLKQLEEDGVTEADLRQAIIDYYTDYPLAEYAYTLTKDSSTGFYSLTDISDTVCGTIEPVSTIENGSKEIPNGGAVYTFIDTALHLGATSNTSGRVVITDSSGLPKKSSVTTQTLNKVVTDSGWQTPPSIGYHFDLYNQNLNVQYRKVGQTVYLRGSVTPSRVLKAEDMTEVMIIFNLPSGYRPSRTCSFVCQGSGRKVWLLNIEETGEVRFSRYGTDAYEDCPVGAWLPFNVSFLIN